MDSVYLKKKRDKPAKQHHPWIFSGAVEKITGKPEAGDLVKVIDSDGQFIAWGQYSPASQICVRLLEWDEDVQVDESWWEGKLSAAISRRNNFTDTDCYRLVHAESDMLPGLVVDKYADFLVVQALTAGIEKIKPLLVQQLDNLLKPAGIYERSDVEVRKLEGLNLSTGTLSGATPPDLLEVKEAGYRFLVDVKTGQKTGFFLDQRTTRKIVASYAKGLNVLDCFAYTGGFSTYALAEGGAKSATCLDSSETALSIAQKNLELNGVAERAKLVEGNVFQLLRTYRDSAQSFDMIIVDPPKLAPTRAQAEKASRAYKDVNLLAMKLLNPGGLLITFSCSGGIDASLFREIILWASIDAGREVQILEQLSQGSDHPIRLSFPESEYLKGLICRVL